jgi:hypothetical protein
MMPGGPAAGRAEGFEAQARVEVRYGDRHVIAMLHTTSDSMLGLKDDPRRRLCSTAAVRRSRFCLRGAATHIPLLLKQ